MVDHEGIVRTARCLNRRGYLTDAGLASIEADPSYAMTGSWDGPPGESAASWRIGDGGTTYFTTSPVGESVDVTKWV